MDTNSVYISLVKQLGYDPNDNSTDIETPKGIGDVACAAVLEFRHHDKSNQLGDLAQGPYSDWTGYRSLNTASPVPARSAPADPNGWQPLTFVNSTGDQMAQRFVGAQWCFVTPFETHVRLRPSSHGHSISISRQDNPLLGWCWQSAALNAHINLYDY